MRNLLHNHKPYPPLVVVYHLLGPWRERSSSSSLHNPHKRSPPPLPPGNEFQQTRCRFFRATTYIRVIMKGPGSKDTLRLHQKRFVCNGMRTEQVYRVAFITFLNTAKHLHSARGTGPQSWTRTVLFLNHCAFFCPIKQQHEAAQNERHIEKSHKL